MVECGPNRGQAGGEEKIDNIEAMLKRDSIDKYSEGGTDRRQNQIGKRGPIK